MEPHDAELGERRLTELLPRLSIDRDACDPLGLSMLTHALFASEAVARYLQAEPDIARPILAGASLREPKAPAVFRDELRRARAASTDDDDFGARVAAYRVREWVRITTRELSGQLPVDEILLELSELAFAIVDVVARYVLRRERSRTGPREEVTGKLRRAAGFLVLAQGKLAGRELNLSSDIDIQFLYSSDDDVEGADKTLHERYLKIARQIVQLLTAHTPHGSCYRVDTNLRPEGQKGALVNSLAGIERYYETFGQTWERLALIRAAPAGGAHWVFEEFQALVRPFVYPRTLQFDAVLEIRALKDRLHTEHRVQERLRSGIDIKRAPGTIREVELFTQIFSLLFGGRDTTLREPNVLLALSALHFAGHLGTSERDTLSEAYRFLRRLENAIQAVDERQTHVLPDDDLLRRHLARILGIQGKAPERRLLRLTVATRARVRSVTARLFGDPKAQRVSDLDLALSNDFEVRRAALARLGFTGPDEASNVLAALGAGVGGPFCEHAPERLRALAQPILSDIVKSADPDLALRLAVPLDRELRKRPRYFEMLAEDAALRRRLYDLLGASESLGHAIALYPELVDRLAELRDPSSLTQGPGVNALYTQACERLRLLGDLELRLRSLRRMKLSELLRIGLLDISQHLSIDEVLTQLSDLAEALLRAAFDVARGDGELEGFVVLGLGRLGSREMGYGSDLDLLFVYDGTEERARERAVPLAQKLIRQLTYTLEEGPLYPIDTRLRPSGNQGPLVSSARGFIAYHREHAMLWERQALVRARCVAGDERLGERVLGELDHHRYPPVLSDGAAAEIDRMRRRMEDERASHAADSRNLKLGRGGTTDVEFVVQYLVLQHAHKNPTLKQTNTLATLAELERTGVLTASDARGLADGYRFLRILENRSRIVHDRPTDELRMSDIDWQKLAKRMSGAKAVVRPDELRADLERTTERVRAIYEHVFRTAS